MNSLVVFSTDDSLMQQIFLQRIIVNDVDSVVNLENFWALKLSNPETPKTFNSREFFGPKTFPFLKL